MCNWCDFHRFHASCVERALAHRGTRQMDCPTCRRPCTIPPPFGATNVVSDYASIVASLLSSSHTFVELVFAANPYAHPRICDPTVLFVAHER